MAAGNINPKQTAAVAPVNWNASQILGMKFAPMKIRMMRTVVNDANLKLSKTNGLDDEKRRPSTLILRG